VEIAEPATQLALVIEAAPEDGLPARIIPELAYRPLAEMIQLPFVAKHLGPLLERHRRSIEILRQRAEARDNVIFFDVSDLDLEGYNKFIPYLLHPECVYSVSVSASAVRAKVSLGTNPWNQASADKNLASLAEKFGAAAIREWRLFLSNEAIFPTPVKSPANSPPPSALRPSFRICAGR